MVGRRPGSARRTALVVGVVPLALGAAGCSTGGSTGNGAAPESSAAAALSSAAQASPGAYGTPADPSLPNPTAVATDAPQAAATAGSAAVVVLTFADWDPSTSSVVAGAYVQGLVESGGTCTLTATGPGGTASSSVTAEPDAGSTTCPGLELPDSELRAGAWQVVVDYDSPTASGTSEQSTVVVP